jgi:hypothetical protein
LAAGAIRVSCVTIKVAMLDVTGVPQLHVQLQYNSPASVASAEEMSMGSTLAAAIGVPLNLH